MGVHAAPKLVTGMAVMICVVITGLNVKLLFDLMTG
jgi:Mn2+/Fe2+ NRAMP family transporter